VTWNLEPTEPRLGVIQVNRVAETTPAEIRTAIEDLQARRATHFALDLRGNHGGLLDAGVEVARMFLEDGAILEEHYRGQEVEKYEVKTAGPFADLPLVVLVNAETASAAEIIAGAIQVQRRAPLIGTHTYGKDSIQLIFELDDHSSLHVTAAKWWVPGIEPPIGEGGLRPDIEVNTGETPEGAESDPFIQAAIQAFFSQP